MADILNIKASFDDSEARKGAQSLIEALNDVQKAQEQLNKAGTLNEIQEANEAYRSKLKQLTDELNKVTSASSQGLQMLKSQFDTDVFSFIDKGIKACDASIAQLDQNTKNVQRSLASLPPTMQETGANDAFKAQLNNLQSYRIELTKTREELEKTKQEYSSFQVPQEEQQQVSTNTLSEGQRLSALKDLNTLLDEQKKKWQELEPVANRANNELEVYTNELENLKSKQGSMDATMFKEAANSITDKIAESTLKASAINEQFQTTTNVISSLKADIKDLEDGAIKSKDEATKMILAYKDMDSVSPVYQKLLETFKAQQQQVEQIGPALEKAKSNLASYVAQYKELLSNKGNMSAADFKAQKGTLESQITVASQSAKVLETQYSQAQQKVQAIKNDIKEVTAENGVSAQKAAELSQKYEETNEKVVHMRTQIINLREQMMRMIDAGQMNSQEFGVLAEKAAKLKKEMGLANATMAYMANPRKGLATMKSSISGLVSVASVGAGVFGLFNEKQEDLIKIQTKLQSLMSITMGLQGTMSLLSKKEALMQSIMYIQKSALAKAITIETVAKETNTAATTKATIAQAAFNLVAKANPYVLLATALLTVVGAAWALVKANESAKKSEEEHKKEIKEKTEAQKKYADTVVSTASSSVSAYSKLKEEYNRLGDDMKAKQKFIDDNKEAFHKLGFSVNGVSDAENLFVKNTSAVIQAMTLRAQAAALESQLEDNWTKYYRTRMDNEQKYGKVAKYKQGTIVSAEQIGTLQKDVDYNVLASNGGFQLTATGAVKLTQQKAQQAGKNWKQADNEAYIKTLADNQKISAELTSTQNKIDSIINKAGIKEYTEDKATKTSKSGKTHTTADTLKDESKAIEDAFRQQEELRKQNIAEEQKLRQYEIDAMAEGSAKKIAQLRLDAEKENTAIKESYRKQQIDAIEREKTAFEADKANQGKNYYKSAQYTSHFDSSGNLIINEEIQKQQQIMLDRAHDSQLQKEAEYYQRTLDALSNFEDKKRKIQEEAKEQQSILDSARQSGIISNSEYLQKTEILKQATGEAISKIVLEQIKKDIDWDSVFGDLESMSTSMLKMLSEQLAGINKSEMQPEQIKVITEQQNKLNDVLNSRGLSIGKLISKYREYRKAVKDANDAETLLGAMQKNLERMKKSGASTDEIKIQEKAIKEQEKVTQKNRKDAANAKKDISTIAETANKYTQQTIQMVGSATDALSKFGVEVPQEVGQIMDGMSSMASGFSSIMQGDIIGGIQGMITGAASMVTGFIDLFNSASEKRYQERLKLLNSTVDALKWSINSLNDTMNQQTGLSALKTYEKVQARITALQKTQSDLIKSQAGHSTWKTHSLWYELNKKGYSSEFLNNILNMTPEQLKEWLASSEGTSFSATAATIEGKSGYSGSDFVGDLQSYADLVSELENSTDKINEALNGVSFDNLKDEFRSLATTATTSMNDIEKSFDSFARSAAWNKISEKYFGSDGKSGLLGSYYEQLTDLNKQYNEGTLNESEYRRRIAELKLLYEQLNKQAKDEYEQSLTAAGINIQNSEQSATQGGFESMSEDTGSELNGRFAALQAQGVVIAENTSIMVQNLALIGSTASEIRDYQFNCMRSLNEIVENTNHLIKIDETLEKIKNNTDKL